MSGAPVRFAAAVALGLALLTGCSEDQAQKAVDQARDRASTAIEDADLPNVEWSKYGDDLRNRLEKLGEKADCAGLKRELAATESNDAELTRYIKALLRKADC